MLYGNKMAYKIKYTWKGKMLDNCENQKKVTSVKEEV